MLIEQEQIKAENLIVDEYGLVYSNDGETLMGYTIDFDSEEVIIKSDTRVIADHALYNEEGNRPLKKVVIADSVEIIGELALLTSKPLEVVTLPTSLKKIGAEAFNVVGTDNPFITPHVYECLEIDACSLYLDALMARIKVKNLILTAESNDVPAVLAICNKPNLQKLTVYVADFGQELSVTFTGCDNLKEFHIYNSNNKP